jgi:hypothetical protein
MRHTSLLGQPKPVPLLPPGVVSPASLGLLVTAAGLPHRLTPRLPAAGIRAIPLPAIAARAHYHLASTPVAAQQSSVARGPAASPTDRRATCESSLEDLYSSTCGARPPWRQRAWFPTPFWPAAGLFPSSGLSPSSLSASHASKPNNRPRLLSDNYLCASHTGRCRHPHDRSMRFSISIDDAVPSPQTAGYSQDRAVVGYRSHSYDSDSDSDADSDSVSRVFLNQPSDCALAGD